LIARNPAVPSLPVPESTIPIARDPHSSASDSKKWSIATLTLCSLRTSVIAPSFAMTHLFDGWT
jgi:hypothetical protein